MSIRHSQKHKKMSETGILVLTPTGIDEDYSMTETALQRVERILSGKPTCPFDFFNNTMFYDPKPPEKGEYADRLKAQPVVAYAAVNAVSRGVELVFPPGAMSNGYAAYALAEDYAEKIRQATASEDGGHGYNTTQRLKHRVAGEELLNRVILPNRLQNANINALARDLYTDKGVMGVIGFEGSVRTTRSNNALSQGATFQDWTFERWWGPRVIDSAAMMLHGDHAYSRYGALEELLGDQIQCGLLDDYRRHIGPGKKYDVVDAQGVHITLTDRAWETAKHIVDVVERGFRSDLALAALVGRFQLDDWLRTRHDPTPIDRRKLHPVLADRSADELARMDRLKEIMLPYIAAKCVSWSKYAEHDGLNAYYAKNILPLTPELPIDNTKALVAELFAYQPKGGFAHPVLGQGMVPSVKNGLSKVFDGQAMRKPQLQIRDDNYFAPRAALFEDHHFSKLSVWEQAALTFILPAMESVDLSTKASKRFMYLCDPKGGAIAGDWARKHGVSYLKEAQSAEGQYARNNFYKNVIVKSDKAGRKAVDALARENALAMRGVGNVFSTLDFLDVRAVAQKNRAFVASPGEQRYSSRAHLALQIEFFDRQAEGLVLGKEWANHPHHNQLVVRAVLNAVGLVDRGYDGGKYQMEIFEYDTAAQNETDRLKKLDLHDLLTAMAASVEPMMAQVSHVPDKATYLACARLLEITDKLVDPGRANIARSQNRETGKEESHEIIDWRAVDPALIGFMYTDPQKKADLSATKPGQAQSLRDRLRAQLLQVAVLEFEPADMKGLGEDYHAAWAKVHGYDASERYTKRDSDGVKHISNRPT